MVHSAEHQGIVREFGWVCKKRNLKVIREKSNAMMLRKKKLKLHPVEVGMNAEALDVVSSLLYL